MLERLKPSEAEIRALALRETDPAQAAKFGPIARGPLFALVALGCLGLAALPALVLRLLRGRSGASPGPRTRADG